MAQWDDFTNVIYIYIYFQISYTNTTTDPKRILDHLDHLGWAVFYPLSQLEFCFDDSWFIDLPLQVTSKDVFIIYIIIY